MADQETVPTTPGPAAVDGPPQPPPNGPDPEWLAVVRYRYLHEPEFHAMIEYVVRERDEYVVREREQRARPNGVPGALLALTDLRTALRTIRSQSPAYAPDTGPTAADNLGEVLSTIEHCLNLIGTYLGVRP